MRLFNLLLVLFIIFSLTQAKLPRSECTIMKSPLSIPRVGVVCANPERAELIATQYFEYFYIHTDFRGYKVYVGTYKSVPMFAAYIGLGSASAAFLMEELIAYDAQVIIRLGTNDYNITERDVKNVYIIEQSMGLTGLMQDYGFPPNEWGRPIRSNPELVTALMNTAKKIDNIVPKLSIGYNIDAFYSFFDSHNVAKYPDNVRMLQKKYEDNNASCRDMETAAVLLLGEIHKVKTASVLQAVVKHGNKHEGVGTTGIVLVLETLIQQHNELFKTFNFQKYYE